MSRTAWASKGSLSSVDAALIAASSSAGSMTGRGGNCASAGAPIIASKPRKKSTRLLLGSRAPSGEEVILFAGFLHALLLGHPLCIGLGIAVCELVDLAHHLALQVEGQVEHLFAVHVAA